MSQGHAPAPIIGRLAWASTTGASKISMEPSFRIGFDRRCNEHPRCGATGPIYLLGDPAYYSRFGYSLEAAAPFDCVYSGPHFMALPLVEPLPVSGGELRYAPAFEALG